MTRQTIEDIAARYPGRWLQGYVRGKLRSDPAYAAALELLNGSSWPVLDVGCGIGLFACYLRENGCVLPVHGFDPDAPKIDRARSATARYGDMKFEVGDATTHPGQRGNVVILDVLHYLTPEEQQTFLRRVADMIAPGACCVIRTTARDESWRFRVTVFEEFVLRAIGWMKAPARHFPTLAEIEAPFRERGFRSEIRPLWGRTPFNSYLLAFRAPAPGVG